MAIGRVGRGLVSPLLAVNFVVYLIILGLAAWSLNKYINGEQNHPRRLLDFLSSSSPSSSSFIFFKIKNSLRRLSNNYAKFFFFWRFGWQYVNMVLINVCFDHRSHWGLLSDSRAYASSCMAKWEPSCCKFSRNPLLVCHSYCCWVFILPWYPYLRRPKLTFSHRHTHTQLKPEVLYIYFKWVFDFSSPTALSARR